MCIKKLLHFPCNNLAFIFIIRIIKKWLKWWFLFNMQTVSCQKFWEIRFAFSICRYKRNYVCLFYFEGFSCFFQLHFILLFKCFLCCLQVRKKITTIIFTETNRGSKEVQMKSYICKGRIEKQFTLIQSRVSLLDYRLIVFTNTLPRGF